MTTISRREILATFLPTITTNRQEVSLSLDPFEEPLTLIQVYHLLRRATFGVSHEVAAGFVGKKASEVVDRLLSNAEAKKSPEAPYWANTSIKDSESDKLGKFQYDYNEDLMQWWIKLMSKDSDSVLEKMVLFWHGHFVSQYDICNIIIAPIMYRQNDLFRKMYLGNFGTFLEKITIDGAMLLYLNGNSNIKDAPNENYARELMELFSMGIGNYTEDDVREAAKILTGWKIVIYNNHGEAYQPTFDVNKFDTGTKTFFGEKFEVNYPVNKENVYKNSIQQLIAVILKKKSKEVANFMCNKLYRALVYSNPEKVDQQVITNLANIFISSNFDLKAVVSAILKSKHFFDPQNVGVQIKSPAETVVGFSKNFVVEELFQRQMMSQMGMQLLSPPNVAGWKGYRSWMTTKTYPYAIKYLTEIINNQSNNYIADWARKFGTFDDPHKLTISMATFFLGKIPDDKRMTRLTQILLAGAPDYEWFQLSKNSDTAGFKLKGLLKEIVKAPDFYLC